MRRIGILALCLMFHLNTAAYAEPTLQEIVESVADVATSWPANLGDLPAYAGGVEVMPVGGVVRMMSAFHNIDVSSNWLGFAAVHMPRSAPDRYTLDCKRMGRNVIELAQRQRTLSSEEQTIRNFFSDAQSYEVISAVTPIDAEVVMQCNTTFRLADQDEQAVAEGLKKILEQRYFDPPETGRRGESIFSGWKGGSSNRIIWASLEVERGSSSTGGIEVYITTISARSPSSF